MKLTSVFKLHTRVFGARVCARARGPAPNDIEV